MEIGPELVAYGHNSFPLQFANSTTWLHFHYIVQYVGRWALCNYLIMIDDNNNNTSTVRGVSSRLPGLPLAVLSMTK